MAGGRPQAYLITLKSGKNIDTSSYNCSIINDVVPKQTPLTKEFIEQALIDYKEPIQSTPDYGKAL